MLEVERLRAGYGDSIVLEDISLSVAQGGVTALLGRNGMGKTTLMKAIMGLLPARSGRIVFKGEPITGLRAYEIANRGIGYAPQGREVFEALTVEQNLLLGLLGRPRMRRARVPEQVYDLFPTLFELRARRAGSLSGGEQQQLAIARALVAAPDLLLLDEPSEGIQPSIADAIGLVIAGLAREAGLAVLIVEQNVDMVRELADHVAFIENGRIAALHGIEDLRAGDQLVHRYLAL